ncbi:MAG: peptidoglycan-associated lipoprotein Pal [Pseudomonadota bacterium]
MRNILLIGLVAGLVACGSNPPPSTTTSSGGDLLSSSGGSDSGASASGSSDSSIRSVGLGDEMAVEDTADALIIYFEYDRSEVSAQYADILASHGRRLAQNPGQRLRLEGHADERGTREYNIGLGERRAQAVRRVLLISGASAGQISTVSYGEERPASLGSTESDYEKNRRVELSWR